MNDEIFHELLESIKDALKELKGDQKEIKKDIGLIKEDLGVHILRTNLLQEDLKYEKEKSEEKFEAVDEDSKSIWKNINYAKGGIAFLGLLLTVVTILALFHKI